MYSVFAPRNYTLFKRTLKVIFVSSQQSQLFNLPQEPVKLFSEYISSLKLHQTDNKEKNRIKFVEREVTFVGDI